MWISGWISGGFLVNFFKSQNNTKKKSTQNPPKIHRGIHIVVCRGIHLVVCSCVECWEGVWVGKWVWW